MNSVVVTGATGFIGRYTLPFLVEAGFEVHALYLQGVLTQSDLDGVIWHKLDLMDYDAVQHLLEDLKVTHLLHFAWYTEHGKFWQADENLDWVACSLNLLKNFVTYGGKRALMAGSCAEYDWEMGHCSERETICNSASLYGASKQALYQISKMYCQQRNISFAWGRIFLLYGPGEVSGRFVPAVINGLLRQQKVPSSEGSQVRDFMYVQDVASAFVTLLISELTGAVNIGSGEAISLKRVGEIIMKQLGGDGMLDYGALPNSQGGPLMLTADVKRLRNELGWKPAYSLEEGLAETIDWWKKSYVS